MSPLDTESHYLWHVKWIVRITPRFRLPETTRQADQLVNKYIAYLENNKR